ncbi:MAG TPA: glutamine--fructose-6-phosphate transaminase (isomerizing), partial [Burkholderiaceae bacterium]|nr:glutamine--fructose-6-phosphate transaminase (isomerizing) [Burkholderiaceae bacterium]
MCGIVGAVAQRNIVAVLVEGLRRLEYRGYDSCGLAVSAGGKLQRVRSVQRVSELERQIQGLDAHTGIAHTRWATHGAPTTDNAHPHFSIDENSARIGVVHNGIIENHDGLRAELTAAGYVFHSQTDTEVIAHLIDHLYEGDLFNAVRRAVTRLKGAYAIAAFAKGEPGRVVGAREGSPLVVGRGVQGQENFLASDALALVGTTDQIIYLEEGDVVDVQADRVRIVDREGCAVQRPVRSVQAFSAAAELGPYRHYMQKEIFEQPRAIADTLEGVSSIDAALFGPEAADHFSQIDRVLILACGTSHYAGCVARYWLEAIARLPTNVEIASEYRYRTSVPDEKTLVVVISQSGETADTLAALRHAKSLGMRHTLAICNVPTSAMVRETALQFITRAGAEIGVASTKAFTTQLVALFLLAHALGQARAGVKDAQAGEQALARLRHLPAAIASVLALEPSIVAWSETFARKENALFLGRGLHYP